MFKKTLAASALAVLAVFAIAPAANAAPYVPGAPAGTIDSSAVVGEDVVVSFGAGTFANGESVSFVVDGATTVTLSAIKAVTSGPISKTASATGAASVTVALPANASGDYIVTGTGTSTASAALTFSAVTADGALVSTGTAAGSDLAETGVNSPMLLIWAAAGVFLLGVAFLLVRQTVRRQGASA